MSAQAAKNDLGSDQKKGTCVYHTTQIDTATTAQKNEIVVKYHRLPVKVTHCRPREEANANNMLRNCAITFAGKSVAHTVLHRQEDEKARTRGGARQKRRRGRRRRSWLAPEGSTCATARSGLTAPSGATPTTS